MLTNSLALFIAHPHNAYAVIFLGTFFGALPYISVLMLGQIAMMLGGVLVHEATIQPPIVIGIAILGYFLGSLLGYVFGTRRIPSQEVNNRPVLAELMACFERMGGIVLLPALVISPISGIASFAAGMIRLPIKRFYGWSLLASAIAVIAFVAFGFYCSDIAQIIINVLSAIILVALCIVLVLIILTTFFNALIANTWGRSKRLTFSSATHNNSSIDRPESIKAYGLKTTSNDWAARLITVVMVLASYMLLLVMVSDYPANFTSFIIELDEHIAALMHSNWQDTAIGIFTVLTNIANTSTVALLYTALITYLLPAKHYVLAFGLSIAVVGDLLCVTFIKEWVARPRPLGGYYIETTFSFPSGHSGISIAFFATAIYVLWRCRLISAVIGFVFAAALALSIGISRIYLVEHYITDVVNGWTIGALWAFIGIGICERRFAATSDNLNQQMPPLLARLISMVVALSAVIYAFNYVPARPETSKHNNTISINKPSP